MKIALTIICSFLLFACEVKIEGKSVLWKDVCWPLNEGEKEIDAQVAVEYYRPYSVIGGTEIPLTRLIRAEEVDVYIGICYNKGFDELVSDQLADTPLKSRESKSNENSVAEFLIDMDNKDLYRIFYKMDSDFLFVFNIIDREKEGEAVKLFSDPSYLNDKFTCE
ncbi:MAG TPA: hypothetical protein DCX54_13635 [Flavobacteriales bacterium]|nr:hypothetical protein [Flavobacteriales bacterium]